MSPSSPARRRYAGKSADERRTERRAALLAAARELWQDQGWAAVTMRGVCARAQLTDRYFYENFGNRDELLASVWDEIRDETLRAIVAAVGAVRRPTVTGGLRAALQVVVHQMRQDPARTQILFGEHAGSALLEQRRRQGIQLATDVLVGLARPFFRPDIDEAAFRLNVLLGMGGFVEIMLAWRAGELDIDADTLIEHLADAGGALSPRFLRTG